jgi:hypothetical protein
MNDEIYFSKVRPDAIIPSKRDEDGAFDIMPILRKNLLQLNQMK